MSTPERSCKILVVEDEWLIARDIGMLIEERGHTGVGPAQTVAGALALIAAGPIDAAFLDITLRSEKSFPIAEKLDCLEVPLSFVSACTGGEIPAKFRKFDLLPKPITELLFHKQLLKMVSQG